MILAGLIIGVIALCYGFYLFILKPIFAASEEYATMNQTLVDFKAKEESLAREELVLERMKPSLKALHTALVEKNSIEFIKIIEARAEFHAINLDTPTLTSPVTKKGTPESSDTVLLQLRASGEFTKLMNFINELSHLPFLLTIEKLQLGKGTSGRGNIDTVSSPSSTIRANISLKIFVHQ